MIIHNPILTGSFTVNGTDVASITSSAASITAINSYTASQNILNGTYATTGSNTFKNPQTINSNLIVTGSITAQTLVVQTINVTQSFSSGSNIFGNSLNNTQTFTGSVLITGSVAIASAATYALDVTGTGRFTGALNGTGATFTSTITSNNAIGVEKNGSGTFGGGGRFYLYNAATTDGILMQLNASNNIDYWGVTSNTATASPVITFTRAGAATFSSTIQSGNISIPASTGESSVYMSNASADLAVAAYSSSYGAVANYASKSVIQAGNGGSGTGQLLLSSWETGGIMTFYTGGRTSGFERMRITSGGNVLIGSTSFDYRLVSVNNGNNRAGYFRNEYGTGYTNSVLITEATAAAGSGFNLLHCYAGSAQQFYVRGDGVIYAQNTTVQSISDIRTKENIINSTEGLNTILGLRPVRFDFKEGFGNNKKNQLGFIAQEVESIFPDAVDIWGESDEENNPYKSFGAGALIPVLVKAIQELQAQITELKNK